MRTWVVLAALACAASISACSDDAPTGQQALTVTLLPQPDATIVAGGELVTVKIIGEQIGVDAGVPGTDVSLSTNMTGVTFSPSSLTLLSDSTNVATVIIPFGATIVATAATASGATSSVSLVGAQLQLTATLSRQSTTPQLPGEPVTATVTATTVANGLLPSQVVPGLSVTFGTNTTGVVFSPATLATNEQGTAIATALVPYGTTDIIGTFAGGGVSTSAQLSPEVPVLSLSIGSAGVVGTPAVGGSLVTVTATAIADGEDVQGLPITFATNATAAAFSPATVLTSAQGTATSQVFVPYASFGAATFVTAVNGGVIATQSINSALQIAEA